MLIVGTDRVEHKGACHVAAPWGGPSLYGFGIEMLFPDGNYRSGGSSGGPRVRRHCVAKPSTIAHAGAALSGSTVRSVAKCGWRSAPPSGDAELFLNAAGHAMTRFEHILAKLVAPRRRKPPSVADKRVSPHVLRHTCAMHTLQASRDVRKVSLRPGCFRAPDSGWLWCRAKKLIDSDS